MAPILRGSLVGLALVTVACGGSAFSSSSSESDAGNDASPDTGSGGDDARVDSNASDSGMLDAQHDTSPMQDSSTDSSPIDTGSDACVEHNHNDGFGATFLDCTQCGFNSASLALNACQTYAASHNITAPCTPVGCGGYGLNVTAGACYTWVYQGSTAGYVELAFSGGCLCNSAGGAMTYGQCQ